MDQTTFKQRKGVFESPTDYLPLHVAIITDGNGRWAKQRGLPRSAGHLAGIRRVREIIRCAARLGIGVLTFYSFSTENWKRSQQEIDFLMRLPIDYLNSDLNELIENNIKIKIIGQIEELPSRTRIALNEAEAKTEGNTGLRLNFAINYGARDEIVNAVCRVVKDIKDGHISYEQINESVLQNYLLTSEFPDPDLLIRTSGELRISNFLLWQIAYSELWFTPILWPDFTEKNFFQAIDEYKHRVRRYGAV